MKTPLYIVLGQTATGKTSLALNMAQALGGELINADSRQCYKQLDVVTGKDIEEKNFVEKQKYLDMFSIGHYRMSNTFVWLYDIVDPKTVFSAHDWAVCAKKTLGLLDPKKTPIFVGGTYFYINFLLDRNTEESNLKEENIDWDLRNELENLSVEQLQDKLEKLNVDTLLLLNNSDTFNKRRLIRHIEKETQGARPTKLNENPLYHKYDVRMIGLYYEDKDVLRQKIIERVEQRLKMGAVEEVEMILRMGYTRTDPGLITIGYKEIISYLEGEANFEEMKQLWITHECQYAKRQRTFMKRDPRISWYAVDKMSLHEIGSKLYTS